MTAVPEVMNAVVLRRFGAPDVLEYCEVPVPRLDAGDVLIEVHAVSINQSFDLRVRADGDGRPVTLPTVLGADPTGVVVAAGGGPGTYIAVGDRVAVAANRCGSCAACRAGNGECDARIHLGVTQWGGDADYVKVPSWAVRRIPDNLDFVDATVIVRHYPSAHGMLATGAQLRPGEWVLVMGCAGGLGSAGVEVARLLGARVIAGAGADERVAAGQRLGAEYGVNYRTQDLEQEVSAITDGRGVDVVFENIGDPSTFPKAFNSLAVRGRLVTAGAHGGGKVTLDLRRFYNRRLRLIGGASNSEEDLAWTLERARGGLLHPLIGAVLPLSEARRAHEMVEHQEVLGKVLLSPLLGRGSEGDPDR